MGTYLKRIAQNEYCITKISYSSISDEPNRIKKRDYCSPLKTILPSSYHKNLEYVYLLHGPSSVGESFNHPLMYLNRAKSLQWAYTYGNKCFHTKIYSSKALVSFFGNVTDNANFKIVIIYELLRSQHGKLHQCFEIFQT